MQQNKVINLIVLAYLIGLSFYITRWWFNPNCTTTTHGDLENHFMNSLIMQEQFLDYGLIYPIDFKYFTLGYYHFSYSPVPFIMPLIFRLLFDARTSFLIMYNLLYAFSGFALFLLLRKNKGSLSGSFLFTTLFMFSSFMNQQFTVHGSYHTIAVMPFFLLTIMYLQKIVKPKPSKKDLGFFVLFNSLTMLMHPFALVIMALLSPSYLIYKKRYKLISYLLISALITSFYYIPLFLHITSLPRVEEAGVLFDLDYFSWIISDSVLIPSPDSADITWEADYYYGPIYLITSIIALIYLKLKKKLLEQERIAVTVLIITFIVSIIGSFSLVKSLVPSDRIAFFLQFSLFLLTAIVFSRSKYKTEIPLIILLFGLINFVFIKLEYYLQLVLLIAPAFYIIKIIIDRKIAFSKLNSNYLIPFIVMLVSIIPLTNFLPTTLNYERSWCTVFEDLSFLDQSNNFLMHENPPFGLTLTYLTGARTVNTIGHTTIFKPLPSVDDEEFNQFLLISGADMFLAPTTQADTVIPFIFKDTLNHLGIFKGQVLAKPYTLLINNPIDFTVRINNPINSTSLSIYYHPWWRAFDGVNELTIKQDKWFLNVQNLTGVSEFKLFFDTSYFTLGWILTIIGLIILAYLIKKSTNA